MVDSARQVPSLFKLCAHQLAWQHLDEFQTFLEMLTFSSHKREVAKAMIFLLDRSSKIVRPRRKFYLNESDECLDEGLIWVVQAISSHYLAFRKLQQTEGEENREGAKVAFRITEKCRKRILGDIKKLQKIVEQCDVKMRQHRPSSMSRSAVTANRRNFFDILPPFSW